MLASLTALLPLAAATIASASPSSPAHIYIHPDPLPSSTNTHHAPLSVSPPEAHAILSHHLGVSHFDYPPSTRPQGHGKGGNWIDGLGLNEDAVEDIDDLIRGESRKVVVIVVHDDITPPTPLSHPTLLVHSPPPPTSWDALVTTYMHRLSASLGLTRSQVLGIDTFVHEHLHTVYEFIESMGERLNSWLTVGTGRKSGQEGEYKIQMIDPERKERNAKWADETLGLDESFEGLMTELRAMDNVVEGLHRDEDSATPKIAALRIHGLKDIKSHHGATSSQYLTASNLFTKTLSGLISSLTSTSSPTKLILITLPPTRSPLLLKRSSSPLSSFLARPNPLNRRAPPTSDAAPSSKKLVPSAQQCFESEAKCGDETGDCNGHGKCVQGFQGGVKDGECWVCSCGGNGWTGETCQKQDRSGQFFLLAGTTIGLILVVVMSVGLLYSDGESELPAVLIATASGGKKAE